MFFVIVHNYFLGKEHELMEGLHGCVVEYLFCRFFIRAVVSPVLGLRTPVSGQVASE